MGAAVRSRYQDVFSEGQCKCMFLECHQDGYIEITPLTSVLGLGFKLGAKTEYTRSLSSLFQQGPLLVQVFYPVAWSDREAGICCCCKRDRAACSNQGQCNNFQKVFR